MLRHIQTLFAVLLAESSLQPAAFGPLLSTKTSGRRQIEDVSDWVEISLDRHVLISLSCLFGLFLEENQY